MEADPQTEQSAEDNAREDAFDAGTERIAACGHCWHPHPVDYYGYVVCCLCGAEQRACRLCGASDVPLRVTLVPVLWRPVRGHASSGYRLHDEYPTFAAAARAVQRLRRDPNVAWAYIPDEYAHLAEEELCDGRP